MPAPGMLEFPRIMTEPGLARRINKGVVHNCSEIEDLIEKCLQPKLKNIELRQTIKNCVNP